MQSKSTFSVERQWVSNNREEFIQRIQLSLGALIFILGWHFLVSQRSYYYGEDGSTLAIYFLGALLMLVPGLLVFHNWVQPEKIALQLVIVAVLSAAIWVNLEEKVVMNFYSHTCSAQCETLKYTRMVPFSDDYTVAYHPQRGWRVE